LSNYAKVELSFLREYYPDLVESRKTLLDGSLDVEHYRKKYNIKIEAKSNDE